MGGLQTNWCLKLLKFIILIVKFLLCFVCPIVLSYWTINLLQVKNPTTAYCLTLLLSTLITLGVYVIYIQKMSLKIIKDRAPRSIILFLVLFLVLFLSTTIAYWIATPLSKVYWSNLTSSLLLAVFSSSMIDPLYEELFFRDIILKWTVQRYSLMNALLFQLVAFGATHFITNKITTLHCISLLVTTLLYSLLWLYTKSFVAPFSAHFTWNFCISLADGFNTSRIVTPGLILGETTLQRLLAHLGVGLIALVVICVLLYSKNKRDSEQKC